MHFNTGLAGRAGVREAGGQWGVLVSWGCHSKWERGAKSTAGGLHHRNVFPHISGGCKSETKVSRVGRRVVPGVSLLGLELAVFSPCPHVAIPLPDFSVVISVPLSIPVKLMILKFLF